MAEECDTSRNECLGELELELELELGILAFAKDPADSEFLHGYVSALIDLHRHVVGCNDWTDDIELANDRSASVSFQ